MKSLEIVGGVAETRLCPRTEELTDGGTEGRAD